MGGSPELSVQTYFNINIVHIFSHFLNPFIFVFFFYMVKSNLCFEEEKNGCCMHTLSFTEINLSRLVGAAQLESLPCSSRALQSTTAAIVGKSDLDELSCLNFPNFGQKRTWIQDPTFFHQQQQQQTLCIVINAVCCVTLFWDMKSRQGCDINFSLKRNQCNQLSMIQ